MLLAVAAALTVASFVAGGITSAVVAGGSAAAAFTVVLAWFFRRSVSDPLREIGQTSEKLAEGDLSVRVRSRRTDEIGALGRAIDRMAEELDERIQNERLESARSRAILDAMVEAVLVTDPSGRIVTINRAMGRLAGEDAIGRTVIEAIRSPELLEAVRAATSEGEQRMAFDLASDTETRSFAATVSPLPEGEGLVVVLHDVTELRRTDAIRRDFVANASHELRTPLTSIRGFAETLVDGALRDSEVAPRFLKGIVDNAVRMQALVNDLVDLSRSESPDAAFEKVRVEVGEAARHVAEGLEGRAHAKDTEVTVAPSGPLFALCDPGALDQVLVNLVDNAIKYTPEGGHVDVSFRADGANAVIEVKDDGPGIPPQHLPRIFERFYRVDAGRARKQGGTGLGLAIVKHLVQRMGGEVAADSRLGKGTRFVIRLPLAPSSVEPR
jgi:two-component system phosphate regulon sensor histidine kinase PhoR